MPKKGKQTMEKLLILAAVIVASVAANAASFKWTAGNMYGSDGTTKWASTVNLYAMVDSVATLVDSANAASGTVANKSFSSDILVGGNYYDFYFTIEDAGKTFTSQTVNVGAQATSVGTITFGNMASATQNASNWVGTSPVPEPTSGLLMLLGMAGLALRRRRA